MNKTFPKLESQTHKTSSELESQTQDHLKDGGARKASQKRLILKCVDYFLVVFLLLSTISSVVLECRSGSAFLNLSGVTLVILHIVLTLLLLGLSYYHIRLHFGAPNRWLPILRKSKRDNMWLLWTGILTLVTGVVATITYFNHGHTSFGGVHGKIGFFVLALMVYHLLRRIKRL